MEPTTAALTAVLQLTTAVRGLPEIDKPAVERLLATKLVLQQTGHLYARFYEGVPDAGPFVKAEYREPAAGATSQERRLTVELREDVVLTQAEVEKALGLGPGRPGSVMPHARPEGRTNMLHDLGRYRLVCHYTSRSRKLLGVSFLTPEGP